LGNPISELSIALQEGSRNIAFYEHVIISLVEENDRLQERALSGEAAIEKVTERCEDYERGVKELTTCSREYQKQFTLTWHKPSWPIQHLSRCWMNHPTCPCGG